VPGVLWASSLRELRVEVEVRQVWAEAVLRGSVCVCVLCSRLECTVTAATTVVRGAAKEAFLRKGDQHSSWKMGQEESWITVLGTS
jgi:hypothetical protein